MSRASQAGPANTHLPTPPRAQGSLGWRRHRAVKAWPFEIVAAGKGKDRVEARSTWPNHRMPSGEGQRGKASLSTQARTHPWGAQRVDRFSGPGPLRACEGHRGCSSHSGRAPPHRARVLAWLLHKPGLTIGCTVAGGIEFQGVRAASRTHLHVRGDNPQGEFPHHGAVGQGPGGTWKGSARSPGISAAQSPRACLGPRLQRPRR